MKIEVTKRDLEATLSVAAVGVAGTGADMTTHFVFRHVDGHTEVLANNGRVGVSAPLICNATVSEAATSFTVEAKRLKSWIAAVENSVLSLEVTSDKKIVAKSPKGSIRLNSLDPELFPYWDDQFSSSEEGYRIGAKSLASAFSHVKLFISDKDTKNPRLSVTEVKEYNGERLLEATDKASLGVVKLDALQGNGAFRVHGKDLGSVIGFLTAAGDEEVEIRETDNRMFIIRNDSSLLNVGRPSHAFPDLTVGTDDDQFAWNLKTADLKSSIQALEAGASKEDIRVNFKADRGQVMVSMASASGSRNIYHLEMEAGSKFDADEAQTAAFPEEGFDLPAPHLMRVLSQYKGDEITMGLNLKKNPAGKVAGGFSRFQESRDKDDYLVILVWMM